MSLPGLRAALRIARRDAVRAKGRSVLIVGMIGLPMLALGFADVAVRTGQLPAGERASRGIGAADLEAGVTDAASIVQLGIWDYSVPAGGPSGPNTPHTTAEVANALPRGSRLTVRDTDYTTPVRSDAGRVAITQVDRVDLADPMARGLVRLRSGALPTRAGEGAVTPALAAELDVRVGDRVTVGTTSPVRVTAVVVAPDELDRDGLYVTTRTPLPADGEPNHTRRHRYAVDLPAGVRDLDMLPPLNAIGLQVMPRTWYHHPPPDPNAARSAGVNAEKVGMTLVVVGLATLEVVLLAGTAFAVGARRKRRELALVAATGGDRRDVRRVVLAGGAVLGSVAGALGVAGGVAGVALARPLLDRLTGKMLGPLDVRPLEVVAIVAAGAGTALLATLLPARAAARQPVVAALTGRRTDVATRKRVPIIALLAVACGAALAFWAAGDGGSPVGDPSLAHLSAGRPANFTLLLAGAVLAELGFVACAPALVGLVGRAGRRLPLSLRLAARDAARHRTRSGPAVAAVAAAVAGSIAVSVYLSSDTERQRRQYRPRYASGSVVVARFGRTLGVADTDVAAAAARLPLRDRFDVFAVAEQCDNENPCGQWSIAVPASQRCPAGAEGVPDPGCEANVPQPQLVSAGGPEVVAWVTGRDDPAVTAAMARGKAVVFDRRLVEHGRVALRYEVFERPTSTTPTTRTVTLPAIAVEAPAYTGTPSLVVAPAAARAAGLPLSLTQSVLTTTRTPTTSEEAAARGAASRDGGTVDLYVERGFVAANPLALLVLLAAAGVVTLGATGIATGLAAADSRPDLATLAAVGAAPRVRRRLAMGQAATVAGLGSLLGILAGLVPSVAVVGARAEFPLVLPWRAMAATAVAVPLLAALVIGALTRSRLPMERRIA